MSAKDWQDLWIRKHHIVPHSGVSAKDWQDLWTRKHHIVRFGVMGDVDVRRFQRSLQIILETLFACIVNRHIWMTEGWGGGWGGGAAVTA